MDARTALRRATPTSANPPTISQAILGSGTGVALMREHGVNVFLVGEAFMRAADPGTELARLFQTEVAGR